MTASGVENLKDVPLTKGKKLIRLEAENAETALRLLDEYPDNLVEMKLILTAPLLSSDAQALAAKSNLVSLVSEVRTEEQIEFQSRKGLSDDALFTAFYKSSYGEEPKGELKELFLSTMNELEEE